MGKSMDRKGLEKLIADKIGYELPEDATIGVSLADEEPSGAKFEGANTELEEQCNKTNPNRIGGYCFLLNQEYQKAISSYYQYLNSSGGVHDMSAAIIFIYLADAFKRFIDSAGRMDDLLKNIKKINDTADHLHASDLIDRKDRERIFRIGDTLVDKIQKTEEAVYNMINQPKGPYKK